MAEEVDVKVPAERGQAGPFQFGTGLVNQLVVKTSTGFVLDIEDSHFNDNRSVLLPELQSDAPVLDERRVTGLGVIFAAYVHADKHAGQGLFVTGHTDPSGTASYNQRLSEKRAENVSLLLRGDREGWRKQSAQDDNVDDVQAVLKWQHERAGWDCDPGPVNNVLNSQTRTAIGRFQERYNAEVQTAADAGTDSPFKKKIGVDKKVGAETWGAFYDVYMTELMDLLELQNFSELEQRQQKLEAPDGMPDFVGCGEHVPFDPALRNNVEDGKEERKEGLQHDRSDRRVELLFFDPGEQVKLVCHPKPGQCKPQDCPIYKKNEFDFDPIEIPKGLDIAEANIKLTFVDPEGNVRPFPEGLEVELKFGDPANLPPEADDRDHLSADDLLSPDFDDENEASGDATGAGAPAAPPEPPTPPPADGEDAVDQEPNEVTGPGGVLRFVMPRKASTCFLRFLAADTRFITADPVDLQDQQLVNFDEAMQQAQKGRFFFRVPKEFNTLDGFWKAPDGVKFEHGKFLEIDDRQTKIGSRDAPAELELDIQWQFFRFEYFDRFTQSLAAVPQGHATKEGGDKVSVIALTGHAELLAPLDDGLQIPAARAAWTSGTGKDLVFCLAWVRRGPDPDAAAGLRDVPDEKCLVRFETSSLGAFVRTEGDGKAPDAERNLVEAPPGAGKPGVERLRLYDLPREWWSTDFPVRFPGETVDKVQPFQKAASTKSTLAKPYVVPMDTIVLASETNNGADLDAVWDDGKVERRFTIYDNQLRVHRPDTATGETYFTGLGQLKKQPDGPVLHDFPPFTRLIARGRALFDVFDSRTRAEGFKGFPIGARLATRYFDRGEHLGPFLRSSYLYTAPKPNGSTGGKFSFGQGVAALLRCCGRDGAVELFSVFQYSSVFFDFTPPPDHLNDGVPLGAQAPANPRNKARDCLLDANKRWNGEDSVNQAAIVFHVGKPESARGRWRSLLVRGAPDGPNKAILRVSIYKHGLRAFMDLDPATGQPVGKWAIDDMAVGKSGDLTAAHEFGHSHSLPDEYLNRDFLPSLEEPNIGESSRSPGTPYGLDTFGMMVNNIRVRVRSFWHLVTWFRTDNSHFAETDDISIEHGPFRFQTAITARDTNRVQFPVASDLDVSIGPLGLCDRFLYVTGHDGWTAGELGGSSLANPYDGFVVVRVKMAWEFTTTTDFHAMRSLLGSAHAAIRQAFNASRKVGVKGTVDGKAVRLRVLFAPRFLCKTVPTGADSTKHFASLKPKVQTVQDYEDRVTKLLAKPGVHANVKVVTEGKPGLTAGVGPREALVRPDSSGFLGLFTSETFSDDVVLMFSQLVGLKSEKVDGPNAFRPVVSNLGPLVVGSMELIEE